MSGTYLTGGGTQVPSDAERLEHAQIDGVHGKKVFPIYLPPTGQTNASVVITESVLGTVTTKTITKTISGTNYVKTVATDSSDNSVIISSWT